MKTKLATFAILLSCFSCDFQNKDLHEGHLAPREIHDDHIDHFSMIKIDGIEYLILEKDNNNPHEGFGFMAFRANKLMEKQDTVIAYLKTIETQQRALFKLLDKKRSMASIDAYSDSLIATYLNTESKELIDLEKTELESKKASE